MARPKKQPPKGVIEKIKQLSAEGHALTGIAERFNIAIPTLSRWFDEHEGIREAFDQGREKERHTLHNTLYVAATQGGNASAAMFLLKARHGYREGDQGEQANRVSIVFQIPAAMPMASFIESRVSPPPVGLSAKLIER